MVCHRVQPVASSTESSDPLLDSVLTASKIRLGTRRAERSEGVDGRGR